MVGVDRACRFVDVNAPLRPGAVLGMPPRQARVAGVASAFPPHEFTQAEAFALIRRWLEGRSHQPAELPLDKIEQAFRNAGVSRRASALPIDCLLEPRPLGEKNRDYLHHAAALGAEAVRRVLEQTGRDASEIDLVISTSCTGFAIPALDARLLNLFPFRPDVRRLPVTELGCAAGVAALRLGHDFLRAYPGSRVLIVAMELPTLTFQPGDVSADHLVSCAIFGDGAAALVLDDEPSPGLRITGTSSHFFSGTEEFMGYDLESTGFHIFLSRRIPRFIGETLMPAVAEMARAHGASGAGEDHPMRWLVHPGGPKILDAVEKALGLEAGGLVTSRDILREHGNISSVTILLVLEAYLKEAHGRRGTGGMREEQVGILAVGPGFQVDLVLATLSLDPERSAQDPGARCTAAGPSRSSSSGYFSR